MKEILFWILLFAGVAASSQGIRGTVCLDKDKSAVQFATVGLLQIPDSTMIDGTITLTDGGYSIGNVKPGQYLIRVSFVG